MADKSNIEWEVEAMIGRHNQLRPRLAEFEAESGGTFSGYASLFGVADLEGDIFETGAFAVSLARRGPGGVRMLWQHDPQAQIGEWLEVREDERGLFVRGRLYSRRLLTFDGMFTPEWADLLHDGVFSGLSIGFRTVVSRIWTEPPGTRRVVEADLLEISLCFEPMIPGARIVADNADAATAGFDPETRQSLKAGNDLAVLALLAFALVCGIASIVGHAWRMLGGAG